MRLPRTGQRKTYAPSERQLTGLREKEDARMRRAAGTASSIAPEARRQQRPVERNRRRSSGAVWWGVRNDNKHRASVTFLIGCIALLLIALVPGRLMAQADCLACHADKGLQDAAGHNISVDGDTFG